MPTAKNFDGGDRRTAKLDRIRTRGLSEEVADRLVRGVAEGRFVPGERLIEAELAEELNVSRIPVRAALKALEKQGIVVTVPHRGTRIMSLDDEKVRQVFEVRSDLEKRAACYAIRKLRESPGALAGLDLILARMHDAVEQGDRNGVIAADIEFHHRLCEISGNQIVITLWDALAHHLRIIFGLIGHGWPDLRRVHDEHRMLRDLLAAGDEQGLARMIDYHLVDSFDRPTPDRRVPSLS